MQSDHLLPTADLTYWVHVSACVLGTLLLVLFAIFAVAQASPGLLLELQAWALALALAGLITIWWNDLLGGGLTVCGLVLFYGLNLFQSGQLPGGWVFPLCFLPGLLALVAGVLKRVSP
jgi:hypothetical protein